MTIQTYETHTMLSVIRRLRDPYTYWLDLCFPTTQNFTDQWIDFDIVDTKRRLAPFVAPTAMGKPIISEGYNTRRFKPAYVKPKDSVDPTRVISRRAGEAYTGSMTPQARRDAIVADILQNHRNAHTRRREWMAAQAVLNGSVTISGEDYPTTVIAFGRDANNTVTLLTTERWSETTSDPIADITEWVQQVRDTSGFSPNRITMGTVAYGWFSKHAKVLPLFDTTFRGSTDVVERSILSGEPAVRVGTIGAGGFLEVWVYSDKYEDDAGAEQPFLDPRDVVLTSPGLDGVRCFGAILDAHAGYQALEFFPTNWISNDPPVEWVMTQSAPLMVPRVPNASLRARTVS